MSKSNVQKKSKNYITFLKILTKWLGNKKRDINHIEYNINKYNVDNSILRRILTYLIDAPHIHWYCNKYLNNKFSFHKFETVDLLYSIVYIMDINKRSDPKKFYFLKTSELKDTRRLPIKKLLNEYFDTVQDQYFNDNELNFIYKLLTIGEINQSEISKIDVMLNNKQTIKLDSNEFTDDVKTPTLNSPEIDINKAYPTEFSDSIWQFICDLQNKKTDQCQNCPLFNNTMITLDTNCTELENVDIMFIGLSPTKDENKPFDATTGSEIRKLIAQLPEGTKWIITNFVLCCMNSKKQLEKLKSSVEDVQQKCLPISSEILKSFPAKCYVPIGNEALKLFNATDEKISQVSGRIFNITAFGNAKLIPLIHPSSLEHARTRYQGIFDKSIETILDQFKQKTQTVDKKSNTSSTSTASTTSNGTNYFNVNDDNIIYEITDDLTFFDVRELNNDKIVLIFINTLGHKKYLIQDYTFEFYVKNNNWKNCEIVEQDMDYKVTIPGKQKFHVTKNVREYLNDIKRG